MLIAEFARVTGLPRDTIRFYIKKRLLRPAARPNGYQDFDAEQVDRALLIREHQALGFTLREIAKFSEEFARGITLQRQAQVMRQRLAAIDEQAQKLRRLRRYALAKIAWLEAGATSKRPLFAELARIVAAGKPRPPSRGRSRSRMLASVRPSAAAGQER